MDYGGENVTGIHDKIDNGVAYQKPSVLLLAWRIGVILMFIPTVLIIAIILLPIVIISEIHDEIKNYLFTHWKKKEDV